MDRKVHWVSRSKDKKTGEVLVSYSPKETCPKTCSLKKGGCYAWGLYYLKSLGDKLSSGKLVPRTLDIAIKNILPTTKIARHRVAGDVVGDVAATIQECRDLDSAGLINIGYTHNWRAAESQPLKHYFRASCQSVEEVLIAREMGWATTLIVSQGVDKKTKLPNGEFSVKCPAKHDIAGKKDVTCNTCTLCRVDGKTEKTTVMFEVHGNNSTIQKANGKI